MAGRIRRSDVLQHTGSGRSPLPVSDGGMAVVELGIALAAFVAVVLLALVRG